MKEGGLTNHYIDNAFQKAGKSTGNILYSEVNGDFEIMKIYKSLLSRNQKLKNRYQSKQSQFAQYPGKLR